MLKEWRRHLMIILLIYGASCAADKTLFDEDDNVVIYKEDNYISGLYGGTKAHAFLLYSSWCGHCQRFAPTYKQYAASITAWSSMITVSGVDCVYDTPVCRKFSVRGYPTLKFIGTTTNTSTQGITYDGDRTKEDIIRWTINMMVGVQNPPTSWPNLKEVTLPEAKAMMSKAATDRPKIVVVVSEEMTGRQILLDLHGTKMRYVVDTTPAARDLGATSTGLVVFSNDGQVTHVSNIEPSVGDLEKSIQDIIQTNTQSEDEADNTANDQQEIEYVDTTQQYKLFELDLQSAINTAFYTEVSLKSVFTPQELEDLTNFVQVAHRCGSWTLEYKKQLSYVKKSLNSATSLTNAGWSKILQTATIQGFPRNSTFVGCQGSKPTSRGFTCSLWILFHTMLTSCYNTTPGSVAVLRAIHGYVDSFFTCAHCRTHFLNMASNMELLEITDEQTAVLAFWEAHNQVNERLSATLHDPYFPKVQYPPASLCAECADQHGQFDVDHVFGFLMKHYRRVLTPYGKLRLVPAQEVVQNRAVRYHVRYQRGLVLETRRLTAVDLTFYVFVCLCCAALLLMCFIFLSKRKLKLCNVGCFRIITGSVD